MKIRTRLSLAMSAVVAAAMAAAGLATWRLQSASLRNFKEARFRIVEDSLRRECLKDLRGKDERRLEAFVGFLKTQYPALDSARIVWRSGNGPPGGVVVGAAPSPGKEEIAVSVSDPSDPALRAEMRLGLDPEILRRNFGLVRRRLLRIIVGITLLVALLGVFIACALARRIAAPLEALGREAGEIGSGRAGRRVSWESSDEIGDLVRVFNDMSSRLAQLDKAKKLFFSSAVHELRSSQGAALSMLELLGEHLRLLPDSSRDKAREYLERIEGNLAYQEGFVGDLLDAVKSEMGFSVDKLKPVSLDAVVREVGASFDAQAAEHGVRLDLDLGPGLPMVGADAGRIRQVFANLVSNALKFTPEGGRIWTEAEPSGEFLQVSVNDTGSGIPQRDLPRVFEPFFQGSNNSQDARAVARGTGLGLYLVKLIVERHGGRVSASSDPGRGARVSFTLKIASAPGS